MDSESIDIDRIIVAGNSDDDDDLEEQTLREELLSLAKGVLAKNVQNSEISSGDITIDTNLNECPFTPSSPLINNKLINNNLLGGNGNMNGVGDGDGGPSFLPSPIIRGQEIRPIKAKPLSLFNTNESLENGSLDNNNNNNNNSGKTNLGSLNLYLRGELVVRLNAQQQESGQKWVELMSVSPSRRKHGIMGNGFPLQTCTAGNSNRLKRSYREDPDDHSSIGGGDITGSDDDDSITSNESSSL
ncbi:hypothetical protein BLA29_009567, partial [Euroglyphus maynei]